MRAFFFLTTLIAFTQLKSLAQTMDDKIKALALDVSDQIVKKGGKKVAVTTLEYKGCETEFGKFLAEELTGNLAVSGRSISVVNQKLLEKLLEQNKLTAKGLLEAKNEAAKLGQASGIDALVYGTVTTLGEDVRISLSIVKLPTLEVYGFSKGSFPLTTGFKQMLPCLTAPNDPSVSNSVDSPGDTDNNATENAIKDKDKKCATNHTGSYCFQNATKQDIRIQTNFGADFLIHPGQTECTYGITAGSKGEYTYALYVYRNAKESTYETRQVTVTECQQKKFVVR